MQHDLRQIKFTVVVATAILSMNSYLYSSAYLSKLKLIKNETENIR